MILRILIAVALFITGPAEAQDGAAEQSSSVDENDPCTRSMRETVSAYRDLRNKLPANLAPAWNSPIASMLKLTEDDCINPNTMLAIDRALSFHQNKVALLLPFSRLPQPVLQEMIKSIGNWLRTKGLNPDRLIIWRDTEGNSTKLEAHLAQMVLLENVSIIIGGLMSSEADILAKWTDRLQVPSLILNTKAKNSNLQNSFYIGPDYTLLGASLHRYAANRRLRKIAVIQPQFGHDQEIINQFTELAKQKNIKITGPLVYNPADYSSIDSIIKKIFHIEDEDRKAELLDQIKIMQGQAEQSKMPFDAGKVVLPPIIDVDAILVADHFKNLRHISKTLSYYGVKRLPLLGIPRWRALELVEPADENLIGSAFVDYIGSYGNLPYGIKVSSFDNGNFVEGTQVGLIDLKLLLHHALFVAVETLTKNYNPRHALHKKMIGLKGPQSGFFNFQQVFHRDRRSAWPGFVFAVGDRSISLLESTTRQAQPLQKTEIQN